MNVPLSLFSENNTVCDENENVTKNKKPFQIPSILDIIYRARRKTIDYREKEKQNYTRLYSISKFAHVKSKLGLS